MKIKSETVSRFLSLSFIGILTFSFLYLAGNSHLFDFFSTDQRIHIVLFMSIGFLLLNVGVVLSIKTFKQYRTENEILKTKHANLGVYNKVRKTGGEHRGGNSPIGKPERPIAPRVIGTRKFGRP